MGNPNKILPNAASLKCNEVFKSGILLAQLAKQMPWQKKKTETAIRVCSLEYAGIKVVAVVKTCSNDTKINLKSISSTDTSTYK